MRFLQKWVRIIAWALLIVITALSLGPPGLRPETGAPRPFEHLAIFALCGVAFGLGYRRRLSLVMAALIVFAAAIESAQMLVPGRHARLSDFIVDAVAMCVGVAVTSIVAARIYRLAGVVGATANHDDSR